MEVVHGRVLVPRIYRNLNRWLKYAYILYYESNRRAYRENRNIGWDDRFPWIKHRLSRNDDGVQFIINPYHRQLHYDPFHCPEIASRRIYIQNKLIDELGQGFFTNIVKYFAILAKYYANANNVKITAKDIFINDEVIKTVHNATYARELLFHILGVPRDNKAEIEEKDYAVVGQTLNRDSYAVIIDVLSPRQYYLLEEPVENPCTSHLCADHKYKYAVDLQKYTGLNGGVVFYDRCLYPVAFYSPIKNIIYKSYKIHNKYKEHREFIIDKVKEYLEEYKYDARGMIENLRTIAERTDTENAPYMLFNEEVLREKIRRIFEETNSYRIGGINVDSI